MKKFKMIGCAVALIGLVLSGILIIEYFEPDSKIAGTLCSASGGGDSCKTVAVSSFSGIRNVPLLGDIPVALLGFTFYGFVGSLFFLSMREDEKKNREYLSAIFIVLVFGLFVDIILFTIAAWVIKAVCNLCVATYFVTIILLVLAYFSLRESEEKTLLSKISDIWENKMMYSVLFLAFFAVGVVFGSAVKPGNSHSISDSAENKAKIESDLNVYEKTPRVEIDIKSAPFAGDKNAPITIVKYADFNCGHCMHTSHLLKMILAEYTGIVKVVYKNFPLDGNCNRFVQRLAPNASSCVAASASICADRQGKFMPVYTGLYSDTEKGVMHTASSVLQIASASGLNVAQFQKCMSSSDPRDQILKEVEEAGALRIESTPSLFVNNKPIRSGTPDIDFLRALIKKLMK